MKSKKKGLISIIGFWFFTSILFIFHDWFATFMGEIYIMGAWIFCVIGCCMVLLYDNKIKEVKNEIKF